MNWNKWIRQTHRWLSMAFTVAVIVNGVAVAEEKYTASAGPVGGAPARLASVHRSVLVRAAVCHQMGQRATHRLNGWPHDDGPEAWGWAASNRRYPKLRRCPDLLPADLLPASTRVLKG